MLCVKMENQSFLKGNSDFQTSPEHLLLLKIYYPSIMLSLFRSRHSKETFPFIKGREKSLYVEN